MRNEVHPDYHPVIFKDGEHEVVTRSTITSERTREVDGVEHYVIPVDISAYTHPFYTGQKKLVDTEGRVDRFRRKYNLDGDDEDDTDEETADAEDDETADADVEDEGD
jgi:large subunit ribosomal protein L31